jgi:hypothetical protein
VQIQGNALLISLEHELFYLYSLEKIVLILNKGKYLIPPEEVVRTFMIYV